MGNAELFYSALPPGSSRFRRRGKQHRPALQKRFPEIHLKVGGKEGAFALEDHSEQQLTLKGRLPKKMDLPPCTGIHHIHLLPSRYPETDHRNCSGRQHRRDFPMASRKGKFSLPETSSGLRFMRRAGIQPNPRLRKKTGGWLHNRTGNGGLREQISSGLYFSKRIRISTGASNPFSVNGRGLFFLPGIREMLIFPMFCLLFR